MKTVIKLLLIYIAIQIGVTFLAGIAGVINSFITTGTIESAQSTSLIVIASVITYIAVLVYVFKAGYVSRSSKLWSPVNAVYMFLSLLLTASMVFVVDALLSQLTWLPNIMEQQFGDMMDTWYGIALIVIFAPIFEEIFFRGAITRALLNRFSPAKAIFISALIFGIIHGNPVQIVGAAIIGAVLAWMYYKTGSIVPGILVHILNNGLSVYLTKQYPDINYLHEFTGTGNYIILLAIALVIGIGTIWFMNKDSVIRQK